MASLIVGAGILISEKIKDKRAAKKEQKRKQHEAWYQDLEDEHKKTQKSSTTPPNEKSMNQDRTGSSTCLTKTTSRSSSRYSQDGPSQWVDEVNLEKTRSQNSR